MSNLLASFGVAGNALDVYQQALSVIQNNVTNASTPGYARQQLALVAQPMNIRDGLIGGVGSGGLESSSDSYANSEVQRQLQTLGLYTAQSQGTSAIQSLMDISGSTGVSGALNSLFQSFSAWSASPTDPTTGQAVISAAGSLADSIRGLANSLTATSSQMDSQIQSTVGQINTIAAQIQQYNVQVLRSPQPDPGAQAQLESSLENLSQLVNFSTVTQQDGTITVLLGGSSPLVIGKQVNQLSSAVTPQSPNAPPAAQILDAQGNDITSELTGGQLGGQLDVRNRILGNLLGNSQQPASLNALAQGLADTVNGILESGTVSTAPGAANGSALLTYDSSNPTGIAASLQVSSTITPDQLAPVDSSGNANGNANTLAALGNATSGQGTIGGLNYLAYYGQMASTIGAENQTATTNQSTQQTVSSQAQALRDKISGVSLDQEAVSLLQFQRGYQATAQVLTVLNSIADSTLSIMPPAS